MSDFYFERFTFQFSNNSLTIFARFPILFATQFQRFASQTMSENHGGHMGGAVYVGNFALFSLFSHMPKSGILMGHGMKRSGYFHRLTESYKEGIAKIRYLAGCPIL